jgi:hypothetical protein
VSERASERIEYSSPANAAGERQRGGLVSERASERIEYSSPANAAGERRRGGLVSERASERMSTAPRGARPTRAREVAS